MTTQKMIGRRLQAKRVLLGLPKGVLAEKSGIPKRSISYLERGEFVQINPEMLEKLANALETNVGYFFGESNGDQRP